MIKYLIILLSILALSGCGYTAQSKNSIKREYNRAYEKCQIIESQEEQEACLESAWNKKEAGFRKNEAVAKRFYDEGYQEEFLHQSSNGCRYYKNKYGQIVRKNCNWGYRYPIQ